jgi:hypothetical protein
LALQLVADNIEASQATAGLIGKLPDLEDIYTDPKQDG